MDLQVNSPKKRARTEEDSDEDDRTSPLSPSQEGINDAKSKRVVLPHPYGIQPAGNFWMDLDGSSQSASLRQGSGNFGKLEDVAVVEMLKCFGHKELAVLMQCSKYFFAICHEEEIWRNLVLNTFAGNFRFQGTWYDTFRFEYVYTFHNAEFKSSTPPYSFLFKATIPVKGFYSDSIYQSWRCATVDLYSWCCDNQPNNIDRRSNLTLEQFRKEYLEPNQPVILTDVIPKWTSYQQHLWTPEALISDIGDVRFKAAGVDVRLADYLGLYCQKSREETPLYLFDNEFGEKVPDLLDQYAVPIYFREDFFSYFDNNNKDEEDEYEDEDEEDNMNDAQNGNCGNHNSNSNNNDNENHQQEEEGRLQGSPPPVNQKKRKVKKVRVGSPTGCSDSTGRPSYRWWLIGPARSGSTFHKDPNYTSAWNALLHGRKKWILFPPDQVPPGVVPSADNVDVMTPISVTEWFLQFYAQVQQLPPHKRPIECIQEPGDLVFIPHMWWHTALNLETSIAVTQNFVSRENFGNVIQFLQRNKKFKMLDAWKQAFSTVNPELWEEKEAEIRKVEEQRKAKSWAHLASGEKEFKFSFGF